MHDLASRLQTLIRPGDHLWWGQATAEPLTLTRALVAHRHAIARGGRLGVFVGIGQSDTLQPEHADVIDFFGYAASGPHRRLASAGVLAGLTLARALDQSVATGQAQQLRGFK